MTKVIDPDQLNRATEYQYDTTVPATRTFQLLIAGNLNDTAPGATSGVTGQAAYSRMILDYAAATTAGKDLRKHGFPLSMRTESEGTWNSSWDPEDAQTRDLLRDFGWTESGGDIYPGFLQLDAMNADTDSSTFQWAAGGSATVAGFDKAGRLNEALIRVSGGTYCQMRQRTEAKTHAAFEVVSFYGGAALTGKLYSILLANASDPNVVNNDTTIDSATEPWQSITLDYLTGDHTGIITWPVSTAVALDDIVQVPSGAYAGRYLRCTVAGTTDATPPTGPGVDNGATWEADPGEHQIGANYFHFSRIIAAASGTAVQVQNWGQRQLRQTSDINSDINGDAFGVVNGVNAEELFGTSDSATNISTFEGAVLKYALGVYVTSIDGADTNNQRYRPHLVDGAVATGASADGTVSNPFKANIKIIVPTELVGGICTLFFQNDDAGDNLGYDFDTDDAIVVEDDTSTEIDFTIAAEETDFTYDYDGNVQRGTGSDGTPAPVIAHALKAGVVIPVTAVATVTQVDNVDVRLTATADTVFSNPA